MKFFVIGAGIWGSVIAERIASVLNEPVLIVDKRAHTGGNCHSYLDSETGIECHAYGSHIFHTSIKEVWDYFNSFTEFNSYRHKVLTTHRNKVYSLPINLFTINAIYGTSFTPGEAESFLAAEAEACHVRNPDNLEEKAVSLIGRPLYEAFIKNYTKKQWAREPEYLPADIISRLPVRFNYNLDYFGDPWQGIPKDGFEALFRKILSHPNISIELNCNYEMLRDKIPADATVIYTGKPDELFDYKYGELEWRSLRFEWETLDVRDYQGTSVMNFADLDVPYTRIHEFKHYHPEWTVAFNAAQTVICREYPAEYRYGSEAYYPVNDARNNDLYAKYAALATRRGIILGGRLGSYRYWDMDKAAADSLNTFRTRLIPEKAAM